MITRTIDTFFYGQLRAQRGYGYKLLSHPDAEVWWWMLVRRRRRKTRRRR